MTGEAEKVSEEPAQIVAEGDAAMDTEAVPAAMTETVVVWAVLVHPAALDSVTVTVPLVVAKSTEMALDPCPEVMDAPVGTVQV